MSSSNQESMKRLWSAQQIQNSRERIMNQLLKNLQKLDENLREGLFKCCENSEVIDERYELIQQLIQLEKRANNKKNIS